MQQRTTALFASSSCIAQHPQLQQHADVLGAELVSSWQAACAAHTAVCIVQEQETLSAGLLAALTQHKPVALPAWAAAAAGRRVWVGSLPSAEQYGPASLQLPPECQHGDAPQLLSLTSWAAPSSDLLSNFTLLIQHNCQV